MQSQVIVSNGSFETNMKDWTNKIENNAVASFKISDEDFKSGKYALQININEQNSNTKGAKSIHVISTLSKNKNYILTFYAKAKNSNAKISTLIKGTNFVEQSYIIGKDWEKYTWQFTATDSNAELQFIYGTNTTYYIDDVSIEENNS